MKFRPIFCNSIKGQIQLFLELRIALVLMIVEFQFHGVDILKNISSYYFIRLFDVLFTTFSDGISHPIFQLFKKIDWFLTQCFFSEKLDCLFFSFTYYSLEFFFWFWELFKVIFNLFNKELITIVKSFSALFLTHVIPSIFNVGNCTFIDSINIRIHHRAIHISVEFLILKRFSFDGVDDSFSEIECLLHEFWSELVELHFI